MPISRRGFLRLLGISLGKFALPNFGYAEDKPLYPLRSDPGIRAVLDPKKAAKARKLAKYVITKRDKKGIIPHEQPEGVGQILQVAQAVMVIDNYRYSVYVANLNEIRTKLVDGIVIYFRPEGILGRNKLAVLSDSGLDGRLNYGIIPNGLIELNETGIDLIFHPQQRIGLEYRERFQDLYDRTLDTLIAFYERPTK